MKQNTLSNENKETNAKLQDIDKKIDELNKENNLLRSRLSVAENTSTLLSRNHYKNSERIINLERDLHKMEQHSRRECIEIAGIPPSITNDLLEEHVLLIFSKTYHRLGSTDRTIVKLSNREDAVKLLENKNKLKYVDLCENSSEENYNKNRSNDQVSASEQVKDRKNFSNKKTKLFLNQSLCPYYRMLYGRLKS